MAPDTLTLYERQTLINQCKMLKKLNAENAEEYDKQIEILRSGYSIQYEEVFETSEEMSVEDGRYVYDVLDMYRVLRQSYDNLKDKQGITEDDIKFQGFDGNNETKNYVFAKFLQSQGLWEETLYPGCRLNSHSMMTISLYPRMLATYKKIWDTKHVAADHRFTADEIKQVVPRFASATTGGSND